MTSVKLYWQKNIDVDYQEKGGNTMLMLAASYGFEDIVEFLLTQDANRKLKNDQGQTAAEIAREKGYLRIVALIENVGLNEV